MSADPGSSRPSVPAAVSALAADVVWGEQVGATVLGAHRCAVYLSVRGSVLPLVTADAVALPTAVRLAEAASGPARHDAGGPLRPGGRELPWRVRAGDSVRVGAGRVVLPGFDVVAARTWRPARVRRTAPRAEWGSGCQGGHVRIHGEVQEAVSSLLGDHGPDSGWLADGIRDVVSALAAPPASRAGFSGGRPGSRVSARLGDAVAALVGRGPGLTPSGDDALAGALLVRHALVTGGERGGAATVGSGDPLVDAVRARLASTTAVSAALLDAAADGHAARPVVDLVDAAVADDPDAVARALPAVLAIGHTSGRDTVTGVRVALAALRPRAGCGRRAA